MWRRRRSQAWRASERVAKNRGWKLVAGVWDGGFGGGSWESILEEQWSANVKAVLSRRIKACWISGSRIVPSVRRRWSGGVKQAVALLLVDEMDGSILDVTEREDSRRSRKPPSVCILAELTWPWKPSKQMNSKQDIRLV